MSITTLKPGMHSRHSGDTCLLEAVSVLAGEAFSDHPETACPVLGAFGRELNDGMPDDARALLIPLVPMLVETRDPEKEQARGYFLADAAVRRFAPIALESAGLTEQAAYLRNLPAIVDTETAREAREAAEAAEAAARAVWVAEAAAATAAEAAATAAEAAARSAASAEAMASLWASEAAARSAARSARSASEAAVAIFREAIAL